MSKDDRVHLTRTLIDKIPKPAEGKIFVWDDDPIGLGVCVTKAGGRTFVVDYYTREGRRQRLTLGKVDRLSLDEARIEARQNLSLADRGGNPVAERKAGRRKERMSDLLDDYISKEMPTRKRASTIKLHTKQIEKHIRPALGSHSVADITRQDVRNLHRKATTNGGPVAANRVVSLLSAIMTYAIEEEIRADNPCAKFLKSQANRESGRKRYFNEAELLAIAHELSVSPAQDGCDIIRLCMLTGCRVGEAMAARFDYFDLVSEFKSWTKPASTTKQDEDHQIPLSPDAVALVKKRRRLANGEWVFPARWKKDGHMTSIRALWAGICKRAGLKDAHVHDLRHTYASLLVSAGHSLPIIGALLGHADTSTTQRYAHLYDEPLRAATNAIGETLKAQAVKAALKPKRSADTMDDAG